MLTFILTADISDGVSSMGSIIDDGGFDLELKFVSFVMLYFLFFTLESKMSMLVLFFRTPTDIYIE